MRKLLTLILILCTIAASAQMRGGSQYDPGAIRSDGTNASDTVTFNRIKTATGTAAAPAYSFSSDPDTGIYSPGADTLGFASAGIARARIDARGNFGVGVVPNDWSTVFDVKAIQLNGGAFYTYDNNRVFFGQNIFLNTMGADTYIATGACSTYRQFQGEHSWFSAPSGDANTAASLAETMRITSGGNVLIGTTTNDGANKLQVNGFTKLGEAATGIKMKVLTGTTAATEGLVVGVAHGLSVDQIISYTAEVHSDATNAVAPNFTFYGGLQFDLQKGPTDMLIYTHATNSENILSKPFTIVIWYKE